MKRHLFDPISFVFGLLFLGFGIPLAVSGGDLSFFDGTWIFPAFLVCTGVVVLVSARGSAKPEEESDPLS